MESDPNHLAELARLRGLGEWMREAGVVELETRGVCHGDVHIKLAPRPREAPRALTPAEKDEAKVLRDEEAAEAGLSAEERAHNEKWRRLTRSSGAPIPRFKPPKVTP